VDLLSGRLRVCWKETTGAGEQYSSRGYI